MSKDADEQQVRAHYVAAMQALSEARQQRDWVRCYHLVQAAHAFIVRLILLAPSNAVYAECAQTVEEMERDLATRVPPGTPSVVSVVPVEVPAGA